MTDSQQKPAASVVILGGGLTGISTAVHLRKPWILYEKEAGFAHSCDGQPRLSKCTTGWPAPPSLKPRAAESASRMAGRPETGCILVSNGQIHRAMLDELTRVR